MNCINYSENSIENLEFQIDMFSLDKLVNLMKTLYPFKINYYNFCKRYLELKSDENRFL